MAIPHAEPLIDTHCHLDAEAFHQDLQEVLDRAVLSGIEHMLTIGISRETSEAAVVLANRCAGVSAVVGIQPNYAQVALAGDWDQIVELARHPRVVGIGETGLDKYWDYTSADVQRDYFARHLELSRRCHKPFVVHCREAEAEVIEMLRQESRSGALSGVMHSFCGSADHAAACIELGMYISFAGMVTFRKNQQLRDVARLVPLDRLLVETDAPWLAPQPHRGKRNEPSWVRLTSACLAEVRGMTPGEMAMAVTANAKRLFRLDKPGSH